MSISCWGSNPRFPLLIGHNWAGLPLTLSDLIFRNGSPTAKINTRKRSRRKTSQMSKNINTWQSWFQQGSNTSTECLTIWGNISNPTIDKTPTIQATTRHVYQQKAGNTQWPPKTLPIRIAILYSITMNLLIDNGHSMCVKEGRGGGDL